MSRDAFVILASVLFAAVAKIAEAALLPASRGPDLLVVLAACVGWSCDLWNALSAGFALGLIEDLILGRALGLRAVSLTLAALTASGLRQFINQESLSSKVIVGIVSSTVSDLVAWGILASMGMAIEGSHFVRAIWIPSALWSALLIAPAEAVTVRTAVFLHGLWPSSGRKGRETAI